MDSGGVRMIRKQYIINDLRFVAKEIINDIKTGYVTEEQGKEALFHLLLDGCGAKIKE